MENIRFTLDYYPKSFKTKFYLDNNTYDYVSDGNEIKLMDCYKICKKNSGKFTLVGIMVLMPYDPNTFTGMVCRVFLCNGIAKRLVQTPFQEYYNDVPMIDFENCIYEHIISKHRNTIYNKYYFQNIWEEIDKILGNQNKLQDFDVY